MIGKAFLMSMALLALVMGTQAQEAPRVEVFTGYSLVDAGLPFATDPAAGTARAVLNGWNVSAAVNANRWFGVVGEAGGYYSSSTKTELFKPANCVLCTGNVDATLHHIYTFAGGPQVSIRGNNLNVFAHSLFGGAQTRADLVSIVVPSAAISSTSFTVIAGGGVDIAFSHRWALRLQPDYFMTSILNRRQNNFRLSTGVVFRSGQ
jgi:opacity protein-like surface antigen